MTTQSVIMPAANLSVNTKGSTTSKQKQTGSDFSLLIGKNLKTDQNNAGKANTVALKKTSEKVSGKQNSTQDDDSDSKVVQSNSTQTDNTTKKVTLKVKGQKTDTKSDDSQIEDNSNVDDKQNDTVTVTDPMTAQLIQMLQTVVQTVMDKLNLSKEQFNQLLTSQGMSATDLLQPENLQQLILANSGETDIVAALTNENLADTINQLMNAVDDIKSESSMGLTDEQIQAILKQAEALKESQTDAVTDTMADGKTTPIANSVKETPSANLSKTVNAEDERTGGKATTEPVTAKEVSVTSATVKTDTSQSNQDNNTNKDLNTPDTFQKFIDNLVNASQSMQTDFTDDMAQVTKIRDIANQIIDSVKVAISSDQTSMELQLNPENLGKVNLSVQSKDGTLTAHFVVQNEISKEAIESQIQSLKETLINQGLKVDAIEVTVSSYAFDQNSKEASDNQQGTKEGSSGKKISLEDAMNMTDDAEIEDSVESASSISGSLVDYTA